MPSLDLPITIPLPGYAFPFNSCSSDTFFIFCSPFQGGWNGIFCFWIKKQTHSPKHSSAQTVGLFSRYTPCGHFHFRQSYNCLYLNMENPACQGTKRDFLKISFLNFLCECLAFFSVMSRKPSLSRTRQPSSRSILMPTEILACEYPYICRSSHFGRSLCGVLKHTPLPDNPPSIQFLHFCVS